MKPIFTGPNCRIAVAGKIVEPVECQDVRGQEGEARALERLDAARFAARIFRASAALHTQELIAAFIELVIADGVQLETKLVHGLDRRLVEEVSRDQR